MARTLPDGLEIPDTCAVPVKVAAPPPTPRAAYVLAGAALAVRAAAALLDPVPPRDGIALAGTVRDVAAGEFGALLAAPHPPLAPLLASPLAALGLDPVAALSLVAVVCGAAAVLPLHAAARRAFDLDAANGAALLYAVTPPLVRLQSTALAEAPFLLLLLLSVNACLRALSHWKPARDAALAGLLAGAAWLARPEGLAAAALAALAPLPPGGGRPWKRRIAASALALLAFAAVTAPWMAAASGRGGGPFPGKRAAVLLGSAAPADPGGAAPAERHGLPAAALQAAGALPEAMHPVLAVLAVLGLGAAAGKRGCGRAAGPPLLLLAGAGLSVAGLALLEWRYGYGGRRHAAAAAVLLVPFAGAGLVLVAGILRRLGGPFRNPVVAAGVPALAAAAGLLAGSLLQRDAAGAEARDLGLRLRALAPAGAPLKVGTFGEPRVAWYAGGVDVRLLGRYGVPPGAPPGEAPRRAAALRWDLFNFGLFDVLVLDEGDTRAPPGLLGTGAETPAAASGSLRAWRATDVR